MPQPRGQGKKRAGKEVNDALLLGNTTNSAGPSLDDSIKEVTKRSKIANQAIMGFARFDLIKYYNHLEFGKWNNRPLVDSQVQFLCQSFLVNGADRFNPIHAIPLVVQKEWLVEGSYEKDLDKCGELSELPMLKISGNAPKEWRFNAAGGHHRTKAVEAWMKKIKKEYEMELAEEARFANLPAGEVEQDQIDHINKVVKPRRQKLEGLLEYGGQWIVTIFDQSQVSEVIGLHISQNETKHVYMQSPEEGLIQKFKMLRATDKIWSDADAQCAVGGGVFAKQNELLAQDYVFNHLSTIVSSGTHYIHAPEMQFSRFYDIMFSSYGGIIADVTMRLENRLRWCFNTISYDSNKGKKGDAEIYQQLKQAHPVLDAISDPLREALNDVYDKHLGGNTPASYRFGNTNEDAWSKAYQQYKFDVISTMKDYVRDRQQTQGIKDLPCDIRTALEGCAAKAALVLGQSDDMRDFLHFPLMSRSVIVTLVRNLRMIEKSIFEVSAWFSPLLYMAKAHGKDWTPGSASAEMIRAIMAHSDYDPEQREGAVAEIVSSIFEMFPEFLNMEGQMTNMDMPHRITKQRELLSSFGISETGKSSGRRGTNAAKGKKKGKKGGDEDDGGDPPSSGNETGSDQEHDNDEDGEEAEEGTDLITSRLLRKERLQKDAARIDSLRAEALDGQKLLNGATKLTAVKRNNLYVPWSRQSSISMGAGDKAFRGQNLIAFHTYEWSAATGGTRARRLRILACIAIMEQTIINAYRIGLLEDSNGGAAAIRLAIEDNTKKYRVARPTSRKKLKMKGGELGGTEKVGQPAPDHVNLAWPDQIDVATVSQFDFKLEVELGSHKRDFLLVHQTRQAQNIIDLVQKSRIAWEDTTGTAEVREHPTPHPEVQKALEALIEALSMNAHIQRRSLKGEKLPFDGSLSPSDRLHVLYRAAEDGTAISRITKNKNFLVLSQEEEIALLDAEARNRQKHRERAKEREEREELPLLDEKKGQDRIGTSSAPGQSGAESQAATTDLSVHPTCPPITQRSIQHDVCINHAGGANPNLDVNHTLDSDPTLDVGPTLNGDLTLSSPNSTSPRPTQAPTTHTPTRSNGDLGESEDSMLMAESDDIASPAKSDDELESNLTSNYTSHKEQGKATPQPLPISGEGHITGRKTEGRLLTKEAASTLKKRQASHSVSSNDSYGGGHNANGKPDRKRRQLGEGNASLSGNALSQLHEDNDTVFSQLA